MSASKQGQFDSLIETISYFGSPPTMIWLLYRMLGMQILQDQVVVLKACNKENNKEHNNLQKFGYMEKVPPRCYHDYYTSLLKWRYTFYLFPQLTEYPGYTWLTSSPNLPLLLLYYNVGGIEESSSKTEELGREEEGLTMRPISGAIGFVRELWFCNSVFEFEMLCSAK